MQSHEVLEIFQETVALLSRHLELRFRLHSDKYLQCAIVCESPSTLESLCAELSLEGSLLHLEADTVIAPGIGGLAIGQELVRALGERFIIAEKEEELASRRFSIRPGE